MTPAFFLARILPPEAPGRRPDLLHAAARIRPPATPVQP
jgi:hypothetical protein